MRAGVLAPIAWRAPPRHYGPWELFASLLTEGRRPRSRCDPSRPPTPDPARLRSVVPCGWSEDSTIEPKVAECLHIAEIFEHADEFDIVHNGFDFLPLTYTALVDTPVVTTIHGLLRPHHPRFAKYMDRTAYVAISDADRHPALRSRPPSITASTPTPSACTRHPAATSVFFGRIRSDKGTVEAIDAAQAAGLPIRIAGIVQDEAYFTAKVAPRIDGVRVSFVGPAVSRATKRVPRRRSRAAAPHQLRRAFRFSVVEAMASGTPVIAFDRGSMGEFIQEESPGYSCPMGRAAAAVTDLATFDRPAIRAVAVERFSQDRMVDQYEALYEQILADAGG